MDFPLLDSALIGFRAPDSKCNHVFCTTRTLSYIGQLATLTAPTDHIRLTCLANIWSPKYSTKPETCNRPNTSPYSSMSLFSARSSVSDESVSSGEECLDSPTQEKPASFPCSNGSNFKVEPGSRFFVIKLFSELDVQASQAHGIWTSTEHGNKRLNLAYHETCQGSVFLFFLVNASSKFCGVAQMSGPVDFSKKSDIWAEASRWRGIFTVRWVMVKDVPNVVFRNLRVPTNDNKCVTHSRDTQEIPFDVGVAMLKIFTTFRHFG